MAFDRPIAYRTRINGILEGTYRSAQDTTVLFLPDGTAAALVDVMATVVDQQTDTMGALFVLDDGTGRLLCRHFTGQQLKLGELVHVVGRIREQGNDRTLLADLVRIITNTKELELRALQLKTQVAPPAAKKSTPDEQRSDLLTLIKELDLGQGADVDDVIARSGLDDAEDRIHTLMRRGDVFELKPGRLKVID